MYNLKEIAPFKLIKAELMALHVVLDVIENVIDEEQIYTPTVISDETKCRSSAYRLASLFTRLLSPGRGFTTFCTFFLPTRMKTMSPWTLSTGFQERYWCLWKKTRNRSEPSMTSQSCT